jgi:hypothetical protein
MTWNESNEQRPDKIWMYARIKPWA